MNTNKNALPEVISTNRKIGNLLALPKITAQDIEDLSQPERRHLEEKISTALQKLKGTERDAFLEKIDPILPASAKNNVWEHNHAVISGAVADFMRQHGVMPTKNAIAQETGLSRQTVAKHFTGYKSHPEFLAETEQFKFMSHNILANVFKFASNGDMKAARLYFEMVGAINKQPAGAAARQNNYIQINNTVLSQENLERLSAEQLNQIESIVTSKEHRLLK